MSWVRLGMIQRDLGRTEEASAALEKNLDLTRSLAKADPDSTFAQRDLAYAFAQLGGLQLAAGQFDKALVSYQRDLEISAALAKADPGNAELQIDLAAAYRDMAQVNQDIASDSKRPSEDRREHWREARSWHQQCLDVNIALRDRGELPPTDAAVPDELRGLIETCNKASGL